jgi:hypothetical protein
MYAALWRVLPGPTWARVLMLVLAVILVVLVLFEWVFPWVSEALPYQEQTVGE